MMVLTCLTPARNPQRRLMAPICWAISLVARAVWVQRLDLAATTAKPRPRPLVRPDRRIEPIRFVWPRRLDQPDHLADAGGPTEPDSADPACVRAARAATSLFCGLARLFRRSMPQFLDRACGEVRSPMLRYAALAVCAFPSTARPRHERGRGHFGCCAVPRRLPAPLDRAAERAWRWRRFAALLFSRTDLFWSEVRRSVDHMSRNTITVRAICAIRRGAGAEFLAVIRRRECSRSARTLAGARCLSDQPLNPRTSELRRFRTRDDVAGPSAML